MPVLHGLRQRTLAVTQCPALGVAMFQQVVAAEAAEDLLAPIASCLFRPVIPKDDLAIAIDNVDSCEKPLQDLSEYRRIGVVEHACPTGSIGRAGEILRRDLERAFERGGAGWQQAHLLGNERIEPTIH